MVARRIFLTLVSAAIAGGFSLPSYAQEEQTVTIAVNGLLSDAPFYIGQAKGFFAKQGLKIKLVNIEAGTRMIAPLSAGQIDVGGGALGVGLFNAVAQGLNVKIVADRATTMPTYSYVNLMVRKDLVESGQVKTYKDLKGLRIAQNGKGGVQASTINEALKAGGLTYDDVVHVYNMSNPEHLNGMMNRAIDASFTTEPLVALAVSRGIAVRFSKPELYPNQVIAALLYGGEFIAKRPEVAKKFMVGYLEAVRFYNDALLDGRFKGSTAKEVIDILTESTSLKDRSVYDEVYANGCDPNGIVNEASLHKDFEFFKTRKEFQLAPNASVESVVDTSFARYAVSVLGPYRSKSASAQ
jgi:NitT/TauT family transport system substrate-binding protein